MLGGSFWIAIIRNGIGATLMLLVFLLLDHPRLSIKKTLWCYIAYWLLLITVFSFWYLLDRDSYIRFAGLSSLPLIGIFCGLMSKDKLYLSLYKVAIGFYILSLCVFVGVDGARLWFNGNIWADILLRTTAAAIFLFFIVKKFRKTLFDNLDYLQDEMDWFSLTALLSSVMLAALAAYWPSDHVLSITNILRIFVTMFMAGVIQFIIFYLYIHLGREHRYQAEKQLLKMNEQLLRLQLALADESEAQAARIRHDIRHHCLLIKELAQTGDIDSLLVYLKQYLEDIETTENTKLCANKSVNSILSAYVRLAEAQDINVKLTAAVSEVLPIRDIDLVAILANLFENAIHGCTDSGISHPKITLFITQKKHKIVIQCKNTCAADLSFHQGHSASGKTPGLGISSIIKAASRYNGETEFTAKNGIFTARALLNLPHDA